MPLSKTIVQKLDPIKLFDVDPNAEWSKHLSDEVRYAVSRKHITATLFGLHEGEVKPVEWLFTETDGFDYRCLRPFKDEVVEWCEENREKEKHMVALLEEMMTVSADSFSVSRPLVALIKEKCKNLSNGEMITTIPNFNLDSITVTAMSDRTVIVYRFYKIDERIVREIMFEDHDENIVKNLWDAVEHASNMSTPYAAAESVAWSVATGLDCSGSLFDDKFITVDVDENDIIDCIDEGTIPDLQRGAYGGCVHEIFFSHQPEHLKNK